VKFDGPIEAITFDFYNTLACHGSGRGRGETVMAYLESAGWVSDPWEHQVLYDVFAPHAIEYSPAASPEIKLAYRQRLTDRLFQRLNVQAPAGAAQEHADAIWEIIGPASLRVFPDVGSALARVKAAGFKTAVISNWQCGLAHFCTEMGLRDSFDHVISSAEVGHAKPDPAIFAEALRRLAVEPAAVLHVGDSLVDDVEGGLRAGLQVVLIDRGDTPSNHHPTIRSLDHLPDLIGA
jgi:putative hydrolase of the HAD superfamily